MQGDKKSYSKKRITITIVTTAILFILPYTKATEKISFLVPPVAEGIALAILFLGSILKTKSVIKKKKLATVELSSSISDDIEAIKKEIESTNDETIKKSLNKQLLSLYEEKNNESTIKRTKLRGDIKKYEDEERDQNKETALLKDQITQKIGEEIDKSKNE